MTDNVPEECWCDNHDGVHFVTHFLDGAKLCLECIAAEQNVSIKQK